MVFNPTSTIQHRLKTVPLFLLIMCAIVVCVSCAKKPRNNPLDPVSPNYERPAIKNLLFNASSDTAILNDTVTISWEGNSAGCEFSYRFKSSDPWREWSSIKSITDVFADGHYTLEMQAQYKDGESDPASYTYQFTVNAIDTPGIYIYPRKQIANTQGKAVFTVYTKGFPKCTGMHLRLRGAKLDTGAAIIGNLAAIRPILLQDTLNGTLDLVIPPNSLALSGTTEFLKFTASIGSSDTTNIEIVECEARTSANASIIIREKQGAFILDN